MAGRTDADYGLVPVKSRVSLSSRPVPPFYNKGNESNLSKQDLSYLFLRHCKLRVESVFVSPPPSFFSNTDFTRIDADASLGGRYCLPDSSSLHGYKSRDCVPGYSRCARYCLPDRQLNRQTTKQPKQLNHKTTKQQISQPGHLHRTGYICVTGQASSCYPDVTLYVCAFLPSFQSEEMIFTVTYHAKRG